MKYKNIIFPLLAFLIIAVIIYLVKTNDLWHKVNAINSPQEQTKFDSSKEKFTITLPEHSKERANPNNTAGNVNTKDTSVGKQQKQIKARVIVYYFHPTRRCVTCLNIENYAKEVFDTEFKKEKKNLQMTWKSLNIEDSVNEHYIDDFKLQFSSLIIARYDNNHRKDWKNLEKVWSLVADKEKYMTYVKLEMQQFLKPILIEVKNEN